MRFAVRPVVNFHRSTTGPPPFLVPQVLMALMEYYCMPADFNVSILEEDELYDDHAQLWDDLSEMLGGEVRLETDMRTDSK